MLTKAFHVYQLNIKEAQTEIRRIEAVLARLATIAEDGKRTKPWVARDARVIQLAHELTTLDGWVMSLYETLLTMIAFGNPARGNAKAHEMAKAFEAQWAKKLEKFDLGFKDNSLFPRA